MRHTLTSPVANVSHTNLSGGSCTISMFHIWFHPFAKGSRPSTDGSLSIFSACLNSVETPDKYVSLSRQAIGSANQLPMNFAKTKQSQNLALTYGYQSERILNLY